MNEVLRAIDERRSIRSYTDEALSEEQVEAIVKAILAAPSAKNRMPWHVSVVEDRELLQAIAVDAREALLADSVKIPADFDVFFHAPAVFFISREPQEGRYEQIWSYTDSGIVSQTIALAAQSLGLGSCIIGYGARLFVSDDPATQEKAAAYKKRLEAPEGYSLELCVAVGHPEKGRPPHPVRENRISRIR